MEATSRDDEALRARALEVLDGNWSGAWTRPSPRLYPHQWSWDSAFVALGLRHHRPERALAELQGLLAAQWSSGLIPHIRFDPDTPEAYFPGPELWQTAGLEGGPPGGIHTSGLIQPPVHALAAAALVEAGIDLEDEWVERLFHWHRYLMEERDPEGTGGITILHPWESGTDNSPRFDAALRSYPLPRRPEYRRVDRERVADPAERPTDDDYDRYVDLVERLRAVAYRPRDLPADHPFRVADVLTTAVFAAANRALVVLAGERGMAREVEHLTRWQERVLTGFEELFAWPDAHEGEAWFVDRDLVTDEPIRVLTCAGAAAPLVGALSVGPPARWLGRFLEGPLRIEDGPCAGLLPSVSPREESFDPVCYWRGPVWVNVQWLAARGLPEGAPLAASLRARTLELLAAQDFFEYFDPRDGTGRGGERFSWSAALALDWLET